MRKIIEKASLVDSFVEISGDNIKLATYAKGQKRLDYMLTSSNLLPFIENVGYTPFYSINTSDHRGVFMDIQSSIIDNKVELSRPPIRKIGTKSKPDEIYKYKEEINKQFVTHRIYERSQQIWLESLTDKCSKTLEVKLNQLDKQITEIMLAAEKQRCSRRHESEWSIELHTTSLMCKYWTKQFKGLINGIIVSKQIKTIWQKLPVDKKNEINSKLHQDHSNQELMKISKNNMIYYLAYKRELIRHAKSLRIKGLLHLKELRTSEGKNKEAAIIGKIYRKEMTKQDWAIVKNKLRPAQRSGISNIEVPDKDRFGNDTNDPDKAITWKRITDPSEVEDKLLERNIKHFSQANETLFASNKLQKEFEYEGVSASVDRLLAGEYLINESMNVTNGARILFEKIGDGSKLPPLEDGISYNEFIRGLKTWSEGTSTSPSGSI